MKIHPSADLFPMMSEAELEDLAADITANGLVHPIMIDDEKQIVDGRNRLAACKIAKVEPKFEKLNGRDPLAYIVSANLQRRNLTKGQQAMALAMIYPKEPERGRGKKDAARKDAESASFSYRRLQEARSILWHSHDLAEAVLKGMLPFNDALAQVEEARVAASSKTARHAQLRKGEIGRAHV